MNEPTIYSALQNNFTQISNEALIGVKLSGKAYKLYAYMCYRVSLSSSWVFNKAEILKHFTEGESAMRGAFKELINTGFLERIKVRNNKGIFAKTDYKIYSTPVNKGSDPQVENPRVDNPQVGNQRLNKKDKINKDSNNKDFIFSDPETASKSDLEKYGKEKKYLSDFEDFWDTNEAQGWDKVKNRYAQYDRWEKKFKKNNPNLYKPTNSNAAVLVQEDKQKEIKPEPTEEHKKHFENFINLTKKEFGEEVFNKWLSKLELSSIAGFEVVMSAPSKFLRDWIKREYLEKGSESGKGLKHIWQEINPEFKVFIIHNNNN